MQNIQNMSCGNLIYNNKNFDMLFNFSVVLKIRDLLNVFWCFWCVLYYKLVFWM